MSAVGNGKLSSKMYAELLEEMNKTSKLLVRRDLELTRVNGELDEKIKKLEEDEEKLKEINDVLEVRIMAKTRQQRETIESLDEQVKERTRKLENSQKALLNILQDVNEEKTKVELEKAKTLSIISNFSDGLLIFDEKNVLTIMNKEAEKFLGLAGEDLIGGSFGDFAKIAAFKPLMNAVGKNIGEVFRKELKIREDLILEISVSPISYDEKSVGKFIILHDITREKTVQRLKTEFVSIVAHQLRTPLSAVKWTLTLFLEGDLGELNEEQKEYIKKTNLSNERMINLVDDLLNLSRIEEGRYVQRNSAVNFGDLLRKAVDFSKIKADGKSVRIHLQKPEKLPEILADEEKINVVIQNLIDNAINYSHPGGEIFISVGVSEDKRQIEFKIADKGIGIPENYKERIFTKFFRAENAVRAETVGSGLGLFINKNIIESHGGKIWFESKENEGATFYFTLPF